MKHGIFGARSTTRRIIDMITTKELSKFLLDYYGPGSMYGHQRLGQAFCNYFNIDVGPDIFYGNDAKLVMTRIFELYVKD